MEMGDEVGGFSETWRGQLDTRAGKMLEKAHERSQAQLERRSEAGQRRGVGLGPAIGDDAEVAAAAQEGYFEVGGDGGLGLGLRGYFEKEPYW